MHIYCIATCTYDGMAYLQSSHPFHLLCRQLCDVDDGCLPVPIYPYAFILHISQYMRFPHSSLTPCLLSMSSSSPSFEKANPRWHECWERGVPIGTSFDTGTPSPALQELIAEGSIPTGRALVPGCGRGYDVVALACKERYAVGIDMSGLAVKEAIDTIEKLPLNERPSKDTYEIKEGK